MGNGKQRLADAEAGKLGNYPRMRVKTLDFGGPAMASSGHLGTWALGLAHFAQLQHLVYGSNTISQTQHSTAATSTYGSNMSHIPRSPHPTQAIKNATWLLGYT